MQRDDVECSLTLCEIGCAARTGDLRHQSRLAGCARTPACLPRTRRRSNRHVRQRAVASLTAPVRLRAVADVADVTAVKTNLARRCHQLGHGRPRAGPVLPPGVPLLPVPPRPGLFLRRSRLPQIPRVMSMCSARPIGRLRCERLLVRRLASGSYLLCLDGYTVSSTRVCIRPRCWGMRRHVLGVRCICLPDLA